MTSIKRESASPIKLMIPLKKKHVFFIDLWRVNRLRSKKEISHAKIAHHERSENVYRPYLFRAERRYVVL